MVKVVASLTVSYQIPDDWLQFCETASWRRLSEHYPPSDDCEIIPLTDIEPIVRLLNNGLAVRKYKLVPLLLAFQSPECALPAVSVIPNSTQHYRYTLHDGFHRYCASLIVGYSSVPARIIRFP